MKTFFAVAAVAALAGSAFGQAFSESFDSGIPATWSVVNAPGSAVSWGSSTGNGDGNYTSGTGDSAIASSDSAGPGAYDTSLVTPSFVVPTIAATLSYTLNFQQFGLDPSFGNVDITTNAGATWTTITTYSSDTPGGGLFVVGSGPSVNSSLALFAGQTAQVRFHYFASPASAWDWYFQVDNVAVTGIPAPAGLALAGLAGLISTRRRRA